MCIVTGIGNDAFFENKKLNNVTVHSLVTRIGEGVFHNSGITIKAYSGAYAFKYAKDHQLKTINLSNPVGVFDVVESVIDPMGFPNGSIGKARKGSVSITKEVSNVISVGNRILSRSKSSDDKLYVYQVMSKKHNNNSDVLSVELDNNIDMLINQIRISADEFRVDPEWLESYNKQAAEDTAEGAILPIPIPSRKVNSTISLPVKYNVTGGLSVSGSISLAPKGVVSALILHPMPGVFIVKDAFIDVDVTHTESIKVTAKVKDSVPFKYTLPIKPEFRAGPVALTFTVSLEISASGSITVSTEGVYDVHATCKNFFWKNQSEKPISRNYTKGEVKLEIGPVFEMGVVLGASVNDCGLEIKIASAKCTPMLEITVSVCHKIESGTWCTDVEMNIHVEIKLAFGILEMKLGPIKQKPEISLEFKHKFKNVWGDRCHLDHPGATDPYVTDKCYIDNREVVFDYDNGQKEKKTIADACTLVNDPGTPKKEGFVFGGWYFSIVAKKKSSSPKVAPYKWNFKTYRLPYFPVDGYYLFKAKWLKPGEKPEEASSVQPAGEEWDHGSFGTGTWYPEPPKPVEVTSITLNRSDEVLHVDGPYRDKLQLSASVYPNNAADKSVTWSSSNPAVATVDQSGLVAAVAQNGDNHETIITCTSNMNPSVKAQCRVNVFEPIPVKSITLDRTDAQLWANEKENNTLQLKATVDPANATYTSVHWKSSNEGVAWVDGWGKVTALSAGTATITCQSIKNQEVTATCKVTVHQHVRDIYVTAEREGLLPTETVQLSALCYPTNADNKNVKWTSSDDTVATVDARGVVTARKYGSATITAEATDGSGAKGAYGLTVERELTLTSTVENDKLYLEGENSVIIGYAFATQGSVRRMLERGYDLEWSLTNGENAVADAYMDVVSTTYTVGGKSYEIPSAVLYSGELHKVGKATYTLQCKAGSYTAKVDLTTTVSGET